MPQEANDPDFIEAANKLKDVVQREQGAGPISLDDLIELLDADDLRNVLGMVRPKGQPGTEA